MPQQRERRLSSLFVRGRCAVGQRLEPRSKQPLLFELIRLATNAGAGVPRGCGVDRRQRNRQLLRQWLSRAITGCAAPTVDPIVPLVADNRATLAVAPAVADAALQMVLDELPKAWSMWSKHGRNDAAAERYSELLRMAPACWQLLQCS